MNNIIDLVNACEITATNVHMRERGLDGTLANDVLLHSAQSGYFSARAELEAAVTALEKDAARYRWLRSTDTDISLVIDKRTGWVPPDEHLEGVGGYHTYEYRAGEELDTSIDNAMEAK